ncbi:SDR family oxidoreductase [Novispirillum itersonii]|uniref:NAD(P)-dependent dehydrogenase (Short-subunit alcohol dehydrogenase family) n=1 Tax=Novispirillum itersonii TaxID=189 RepID=A0A7W9ZCZ1_NOVIT|nr:SDR family oxidoreductase [Novispirillum itersonii]MBB6209197.1 NAD(P)-dependent dehydrogenase (short-subunit alcohol dehydrogenase family) [Novispirillum itersonii]
MTSPSSAPVALITGGSRGIGAETARQLAAAGWQVGLTYVSDRAAAEAVVNALRATGSNAVAVQADVARAEEVSAAFDAVEQALGPVRGVVGNAGIVAKAGDLADTTPERLARMVEVNVLGSLLVARESARRLSTRHGGSGGSVVLVSSGASRRGSPHEWVDYAATKGAVDTLTIGLSKELAAEGVRVNCVRPGLIDTEIHAASGIPDRIQKWEKVVPMQRAGTAAEVAAAIVWLLGDASPYTTGAILDVGGGV